MKASSATSAARNAEPTAIRAGGPHSASSPTRTVEAPPGGFPLAGPSDLPNPRTHAYRSDLADAALAGRVIASHYADPLERRLASPALLLAEAQDGAEVLGELPAGSALLMLDNSRGWAWGYAVEGGLVGYVRSEALEA